MSKLGDAGEASPLSSTSICMFQIRFVHALCASLGASFAIRVLFCSRNMHKFLKRLLFLFSLFILVMHHDGMR